MQAGIVVMQPNVRRYGSVALYRGGMCFCTPGAMQYYDVICLLSRWQKPWHQVGETRRQPGPARPAKRTE